MIYPRAVGTLGRMHVVLVEPQIPQNTGSIARTCAATRTPLHIVGEIPFEISDRTVRRAGLDYWPWVELHRHEHLGQFIEAFKPRKCWYFSAHGTRRYFEASFESTDALVFGSETKGLGREFLHSVDAQQILNIPIDCDEVRSLNLSNAVSIGLYEARRQLALK